MKPAAKWLMILGGIACLSSLVLGLGSTVFGLWGSLEALGGKGVSSPEELSDGIGWALISATMGFCFVVVGFLVFLAGFILWLVGRSRVSPPPLGGTDGLGRP